MAGPHRIYAPPHQLVDTVRVPRGKLSDFTSQKRICLFGFFFLGFGNFKEKTQLNY